MDDLVFLLAAVLAAYYLTNVFMYSDLPQPFQSKRLKVVRYVKPDTEAGVVTELSHSVGLFDRVRRVLGLYIVIGDTWTVRNDRLPVWTCPKCLGFWISILVCLVAAWMQTDSTVLVWAVPVAGANLLLFDVIDTE